ncbi:MAG: hypothetical protein WKF96_18615 [Solirubrobacteraceae bacterium]
MRRTWLLRLVAAALVLFFLGLAIASQGEDTERIDWSFRPGWLALSLLMLGSVQPLQAELWRPLLRRLARRFRRGAASQSGTSRCSAATSRLARWWP